MKPQFDHNVKASFGLWLDNLILRKGETFKNFSYALTKVAKDKLKDYDVFKSPHPQWVYDSSIADATVPVGATINGSFVARGPQVILDYNNGRVLVHKSLNANTVSVDYAFKEVSLYPSSVEDQKLIFENKFAINPRTRIISPVEEVERVYPAVFYHYNPGVNTPICFGGEDQTTIRIRAVIFADSTFIFDGLTGIFRDAARTYLPLLDGEDSPFGRLGDLKDGLSSFNFLEVMTEKTRNSQNLILVSRVSISPFTAEVNSLIGDNIVAGFADFELQICRFPRI